MIKTRFSLQAILLASYLILIIAMIVNIIVDTIFSSQRNEVLPASICLGIFTICFISGIINVFYCKKVTKMLYWTLMFYLFLPFSIPLIIIEIKYKNQINNEKNLGQINKDIFVCRFLIVTTVLQGIELFLMFGMVVSFLLSKDQSVKIIGWCFLILIILIIFGLISSWVYYLTNKKYFKIMEIFNFLFGWPLFFLNFILTNNDRKNNIIEIKNLQN